MEMYNHYIFEISAVCIEVFTVFYFQKCWFKTKPKGRWQSVASYAAFGVLTGIFSIYYPSLILLPIITFAGIACISGYLYQGHFLSHVFASLVLLIIGIACEAIISSLHSGILQIQLSQLHNQGLDRIWGLTTSKLLCLTIVRIIAIVVGKHKESSKYKMWRIIPLLLCQIILITLMTDIFIHAYQEYGILNIFSIIEIMGILFISVFLFTYYDIMATSYELRFINQMAQIQLNSQLKNYKETLEQHEILKSIEHDIRKFVNVIDELISEGHKEEANAYKKSLELALDKNISLLFTPHHVVSAIIGNCLREAKSLDINTDYDINIPDELGICDIDLTIILGNVLDNALEALQSVNEYTDKELSITLRQYDFFLFFEVINTYSPTVTKKETSQNSHRGYGLKNIRMCISKYGGEFIIKTEGNRFISTAIINSPAPQKYHN